MAKRITRKLNERVKANIRENYRKLKLSDFDGDALAYLRKVRGAAKSRKKKLETVARVGDLIVPKDSEMYDIIQKAAKIKKMSVAKFMKKHKKEIADLMREGDFILQRETDYLIKDIQALKKGKKVFVNDGNGYHQTAKTRDILNIQVFTQFIFSNTDIFMLIYRVHYKLDGDLSHYLPPPDEYEELEEDEESIIVMLDTYYPEITYLKSAKPKKREKEKPKRIYPHSRKRAAHKARTKQRSKRKATHKIPKKR